MNSIPNSSYFPATKEEDFWSGIRAQFDRDETLTFLSSGAMSATSLAAARTQARLIASTNLAPPFVLGTVLQPPLEDLRGQLAAAFRCLPTELAFARNSTFALDQCIFGVPLAEGDEVLITDQEFPAMVAAWEQRARRDGVVVRRVAVPVPYESDEQFCAAFEAALTDRVRLVMLSQVTYTTGQALPVAKIAARARPRGIEILVDGAQAFGHFPATRELLDCDYYGASLHKWLGAPPTSGFLYVRAAKIPGLQPLLPPKKPMPTDVRKLEQTGAQELASLLAAADALAMDRAIGPERKADRLRALTRHWIAALEGEPGVRLLTKITPEAPRGMATFAVAGMAPKDLASRLWTDYRILVDAIDAVAVQGIRVSVQIYTSPGEVDRFIHALKEILRRHRENP